MDIDFSMFELREELFRSLFGANLHSDSFDDSVCPGDIVCNNNFTFCS